LINLDFADVKTVMSEAGSALMAIGRGTGESRAADAARMAISSPLLDISMEGARGVLLNITGGGDLTLNEINDAAEFIRQAADPEANIIFGAVVDPRMQDEVKLTVIATGFDGRLEPKQASPIADRLRNPALERARERSREMAEPTPVGSHYVDDDLEVPSFLRKHLRDRR
jgi:cell division protein FtsZ